MLIINNTVRLITLNPGKMLTLVPGNNQVDSKVYKVLYEDKSFQKRVAVGDFKIVTDESGAVAESEGGGVNLSTLNAPDAIQVIENSSQTEELDSLEAQEKEGKNRQTVLDAVERHRTKLQGIIAQEDSA